MMYCHEGENGFQWSRSKLLTNDIRYFAMSALDHIQRSKALAEWQAMLKGNELPLERAQGAFDLFVLHDGKGDLDEVR